MNSPPKHLSRFNGRAAVYRRYRSRFPREIITVLREQCGLTPLSIVADIGSGTGMLAELFLENGNTVFAVEPNAEMRDSCQELTSSYPGLSCIDGSAETTTLLGQSVDFVTAGRAFHWFNREECRPEFLRILRKGGWVVCIHQGQRKGADPLLQDFEYLLRRFGSDYARTHAEYDMEAACRKFFSDFGMQYAAFSGVQELSYEELEGQILSFSVMPLPGDPEFPAMQDALQGYFARYQIRGKVSIPTECTMYFGQLQP